MNYTHRPLTLWVLSALLLFLGACALYGGWSLLTGPSDGQITMPLSILSDTLFPDFFIPGVILFIILAVGSFLVLSSLWNLPSLGWLDRLNPYQEFHWSWTAGLLLALILVMWIGIEVISTGYTSVLHLLFGIIGILMLLLLLSPPVKKYLRYPSDYEK